MGWKLFCWLELKEPRAEVVWDSCSLVDVLDRWVTRRPRVVTVNFQEMFWYHSSLEDNKILRKRVFSYYIALWYIKNFYKHEMICKDKYQGKNIRLNWPLRSIITFILLLFSPLCLLPLEAFSHSPFFWFFCNNSRQANLFVRAWKGIVMERALHKRYEAKAKCWVLLSCSFLLSFFLLMNILSEKE